MQSTPLVSILIPSYKEKKLLLRCLKSIKKQKYNNLEIVISEDHSEPDLSKPIKSFLKKIRIKSSYYYQKKNIGTFQNMKFLYQKAIGKFIIFMPHDDYLINNNFIKDAVYSMHQNEKIGCYISPSINQEDQKPNFIIKNNTIINGESYILKNLYNDLHPVYSSIILRKKFLDKNKFIAFFGNKKFFEKISIRPDEYYASICIACFNKKILISKINSSVRGYNKNSYSRSKEWMVNKNAGISIPILFLYRFFSDKSFRLSGFFLKKLIFDTGFSRVKFKDLKKISINKFELTAIISSILIYNGKKLILFVYRFFFSKIKRKMFN